MKMIVGLGNPGARYAKTRHNVGFLVLDRVANLLGTEFREARALEAEVAAADAGEERVLLMKPLAFMNLSGRAVAAAMRKHGLGPEDILVVYDDADLPLGEIRFRRDGSAGGHNGMRSVLEQFPKDAAIARVRVGIGRPPRPELALEDWVLGRWSEAEQEALPAAIERAAEEALANL